MSSKLPKYDEAYVWVWLPDATEPIVAGRLSAENGLVHFNYGKSYLERADAIPLYLPELPLQAGELPLPDGCAMLRRTHGDDVSSSTRSLVSKATNSIILSFPN